MRSLSLSLLLAQAAAFVAPGSVPSLVASSSGAAIATLRIRMSDTVSTQKRFAIRDRVECNMGSAGGWKLGRVVDVDYLPEGRDEPVPYRVKLDSGRTILAPSDSEKAIRVPIPKAGVPKTGTESSLEAAFYSFDVDGSGMIGKNELVGALEELGYKASTARIEELFYKFDPDGNGIDVEEFKQLHASLEDVGIGQPNQSYKAAMDLFRKYDADGSGTIDKTEFKKIIEELNNKMTLTAITAGVAGAAGALTLEYVARGGLA